MRPSRCHRTAWAHFEKVFKGKCLRQVKLFIWTNCRRKGCRQQILRNLSVRLIERYGNDWRSMPARAHGPLATQHWDGRQHYCLQTSTLLPPTGLWLVPTNTDRAASSQAITGRATWMQHVSPPRCSTSCCRATSDSSSKWPRRARSSRRRPVPQRG